MQSHQVIVTTSPSTDVHPGEFISHYFWATVPHALVSAEGFVLLPTIIEPVDAPGHKEGHLLYMAL